MQTSLDVYEKSFQNATAKQAELRRLLGMGNAQSQKYSLTNVTQILTPPNASIYIVEEVNTVFVGVNRGAKSVQPNHTAQIQKTFTKVTNNQTIGKVKNAINTLFSSRGVPRDHF